MAEGKEQKETDRLTLFGRVRVLGSDETDKVPIVVKAGGNVSPAFLRTLQKRTHDPVQKPQSRNLVGGEIELRIVGGSDLKRRMIKRRLRARNAGFDEPPNVFSDDGVRNHLVQTPKNLVRQVLVLNHAHPLHEHEEVTMKIRTWQVEITVAALLLGVTAILSSNTLASWVSALGVTMTVAKAQIADRMNEDQLLQTRPSVECYRWNVAYTILGEICWALVFLITHTYPALVGVGIMLSYPLWRRWYRTHHPKRTHECPHSG